MWRRGLRQDGPTTVRTYITLDIPIPLRCPITVEGILMLCDLPYCQDACQFLAEVGCPLDSYNRFGTIQNVLQERRTCDGISTCSLPPCRITSLHHVWISSQLVSANDPRHLSLQLCQISLLARIKPNPRDTDCSLHDFFCIPSMFDISTKIA